MDHFVCKELFSFSGWGGGGRALTRLIVISGYYIYVEYLPVFLDFVFLDIHDHDAYCLGFFEQFDSLLHTISADITHCGGQNGVVWCIELFTLPVIYTIHNQPNTHF